MSGPQVSSRSVARASPRVLSATTALGGRSCPEARAPCPGSVSSIFSPGRRRRRCRPGPTRYSGQGRASPLETTLHPQPTSDQDTPLLNKHHRPSTAARQDLVFPGHPQQPDNSLSNKSCHTAVTVPTHICLPYQTPSHLRASCRAQATSIGTQVPSPVVEKEDHVGGANTECQVSHGEHKEMWQCRGGAPQDLRGCQASQRGPPPNP
ncbi:hypothetical protein J1605_012364 [Eschrichtius robustus]|uniref:Uncharacterized protein n=1 Tax=Eschrichtius robustus TaxID=9764 RepID=A0AB34GL50_ESCRO|nr:hypothetical protein J1605_012364 [Eschrichtius robustus]